MAQKRRNTRRPAAAPSRAAAPSKAAPAKPSSRKGAARKAASATGGSGSPGASAGPRRGGKALRATPAVVRPGRPARLPAPARAPVAAAPAATERLEAALRDMLRAEVHNQLDPLRADLEALREALGPVSHLTPALLVLARLPAALGMAVPPLAPRGGGRPALAGPVRRPVAAPPVRAAVGAVATGAVLPAPAVAPSLSAAPAVAPGAEQGCAVRGCPRPHRSRGYCSAHYQKRRMLEATGRLPPGWVEEAAPQSVDEVVLRRGGPRAQAPGTSGVPAGGAGGDVAVGGGEGVALRACAVVGCTRPYRSRGYCSAHYQQRRLLSESGRLPPEWVDGALPQSLAPISLPRGRRPGSSVGGGGGGGAMAGPAAPVARSSASVAPAAVSAWVRRRTGAEGEGKGGLVPLARTAPVDPAANPG